MIRIAVCDDEKNIRSYLTSLIREQDTECEIAEYASAEEYLSSKAECELLFLDIELKGFASGMDGMELARHIRSMGHVRQPVIIFVTGYESYVYDAFDVDAFQYLVKPVNRQKFAEVFGRVRDKLLSEAEQGKKNLVIRYAGAIKTIPLENIYYMESQSHKIMLYIMDGQKGGLRRLEYYARIGELEEELQGYFCRIHKGYLVNLSHVDEYSRTEITLTSGDRLPLSKYKYEDFVKAYLHFMQ
ncbi:MAG: LytTR family DNA-binding domain-containing protein [Butyrivibrio sp.]|nr:LytTR family DNA-binding domain-containing protein [Muribaculum sp.]MCM1553249.1 LytTR family DNA-binding domain-containing protein [Butyrivibrio sp.]